MTRTRRLVLGILISAMILGSSIVVASQPDDDEVWVGGPAIGGSLGHNLKR